MEKENKNICAVRNYTYIYKDAKGSQSLNCVRLLFFVLIQIIKR